jgi:glycerophosphoryl diester phosphodiesterase
MILLNKLHRKLSFCLLAFLCLFPCSDIFGQKHYIDAQTPQGLKELFHYNGKSLPFISSHRGGPEKNMPENSIATFEKTLEYAYSMMEIDPRYTKDSAMVVLHDPTLQRTTTGTGRVIDLTLDELKKLRLKDTQGNPTEYLIPTFEEMLKWARGKTILVLDNKGVSIEARIKMVERYNAEAYCIVMAYTFDEAKIGYKMDKNIMMQIFIPTVEKFMKFENTGVPWSNVVVFVGHQMPVDLSVIKMIHDKGARCIMGTSRNIDREFIEGKVADIEQLKSEYDEVFEKGIDIIETDIPVPVSKVFENGKSIDPSIKKYFIYN